MSGVFSRGWFENGSLIVGSRSRISKESKREIAAGWQAIVVQVNDARINSKVF